MFTRQIWAILTCCFLMSSAQATVKDVSVATDTASSVETDGANFTIYAGYTGSTTGDCASPSRTSVCNSCSSLNLVGGGPYQCAYRSIHPELLLTITMTFTDITLPTSPQLVVQWKDSSGVITPVASPSSITLGTPLTVQIRWGDICSKTSLGGLCTNSGGASLGVSDNLFVGITDGGTSFVSGASQKFAVKISYADQGDISSKITTPTQSPASGQGFGDFQVIPGDGKVYIRDVVRTGVGPGDGSGIRWQALRVFYAIYSGTPAFDQIPYTGTSYKDLPILDRGQVETRLTDNKVTGLLNEESYMFNIASVDEATIVRGFIDPSGLNGLTDQTRYTATPGEVVGLLKNKKCFIATAAYGSQMEPHVVLLRQFRNEYLLTNKVGTEFVKLYYQFSPSIAEKIVESPFLRAVTRGFLWPVLTFAELSLKYGLFLTFSLFSGILLSIILWVRHFRRVH